MNLTQEHAGRLKRISRCEKGKSSWRNPCYGCGSSFCSWHFSSHSTVDWLMCWHTFCEVWQYHEATRMVSEPSIYRFGFASRVKNLTLCCQAHTSARFVVFACFWYWCTSKTYSSIFFVCIRWNRCCSHRKQVSLQWRCQTNYFLITYSTSLFERGIQNKSLTFFQKYPQKVGIMRSCSSFGIMPKLNKRDNDYWR